MVKLLLVSTSAGSMGGNPTGLWLAELAEPWFEFKAAGYELVLASPAGGAIPVDCGSVKGDFFTEDAKKFMHDPEALDALFHSVKLDTVDLSEFDGMFIAGGHGCCVDGSAMKTAIETLYNAKKLVCADCHGPYALIDCVKEDGTPLVQGLAVTAFTNLEEEQAGAKEWVAGNAKFMETVFKEQGAVFENADPWNSHVAVAGNLVTCQNPQSALAGAKKCVEILSA